MPVELVIQVLDKMERRPKEEFEYVRKLGLPIMPHIKAWAASNRVVLQERWKATLALGVTNRLLANPDRYADDATVKG